MASAGQDSAAAVGNKQDIGVEIAIQQTGIAETSQAIEKLGATMSSVSEDADKFQNAFSGTVASIGLNELQASLEKIQASALASAAAFEKLQTSVEATSRLSSEMNLTSTSAGVANEQVKKFSEESSEAIEETSFEMGGLLGKFNSFAETAKSIAEIAVFASIIDGLKKSIDLANELDESFTRISLRENSISESDFNNIVKSQSIKFSVSPDTEAQGLLQTLQLGAKNAQEAQQILNAANTQSEVSNQSLGDSISSLSQIWIAYKNQLSSVSELSDKMIATTEGSAIQWTSFNNVLSQSLPLLTNAGIGINQTFAAMATLADSGAQGGRALEAFPRLIDAIVNPTRAASEEAQNLNVQLGQTAVRSEGLIGVFNNIYNATGGNLGQLKLILGDQENVAAFLDLTGQNAQKVADNYDRIANSAGAAAKAAAELSQDPTNVYASFGVRLQNVFADIGSGINDVVIPAFKNANTVIDDFTDKTATAGKTFLDIINPLQFESTDNQKLADQFSSDISSAVSKVESTIKPTLLFKVSTYGEKQSPNSTSDNPSLQLLNYSIDNAQEQQSKQQLTNLTNSLNEQAASNPIKLKTSGPTQTGAPISVGNAVQANQFIDPQEQQQANELLNSLREQTATFGQTADAVMRYRTTLGDLKDTEQQTKDALIKQSEMLEFQQELQSLSDSFADAFSQVASGSETAKDAFRQFAQETIQQLTELIIKMYAFKAIDSLFGGIGGGVGGSAAGGVNAGAISSGSSGLFSTTGPALSNSLTSLSNSYQSLSSSASQNIVINSPITVHANNSSGQDATKIAQQTSSQVTQNIRAVVQQELAKQSKPGGIIARS